MRFEKTFIEGVVQVSLDVRGDERGSFMRRFCLREFEQAGLGRPFVQINQSVTAQKGTVRGMHFQRGPSLEDKFVSCTRGKIFDVAVDLRPQSATYLKWFGCELDETSALYVPQGCAHGFQTLQDDVQLMYMHTAFYDPDNEGGVHHGDPVLNIQWPLGVSVVSTRDHGLPMIDESFRGVDT